MKASIMYVADKMKNIAIIYHVYRKTVCAVETLFKMHGTVVFIANVCFIIKCIEIL